MARSPRALLAAIVLFAAAATSFAQDAATAPALEKYVNKEVGFEVMMLGEPQHNKTQAGEGPDAVQHQFFTGSQNGVYMVAYQDYPRLDLSADETREATFVIARDAFQKAIGGERTAYKRIKQNKLDGREMRFTLPQKGEAISRMFFVKQRWYHVFVMGTPEFVKAKQSMQFLDSFKLAEETKES